MAIASTPSSWQDRATASRSSVASGVQTLPSAPTRSRTSKRRRRGTNGCGLWNLQVVHVRAVAAPDLQHVAEAGGCHERGLDAARCVMALMTTVVPWTNATTAAGSISPSVRWRRGHRPRNWPVWSRLSLPKRRRTPRRRATTSVKVPPMSTATRTRGESLTWIPGPRSDRRRRRRHHGRHRA